MKVIYFLFDVVKLIITDNEEGGESGRTLVISRPFIWNLKSITMFTVFIFQ